MYIAYCFVDAFIPDRPSVCLHVIVIDFVVLLAVGAAVVGAVLSIFIVYSELYAVLIPSVVFTFNIDVPSLLIVVADAVSATACAELSVLKYVVVPVVALFNVTYTF